MSFIRRNIYLAFATALSLGFCLPLAASSDADLTRLKILGVMPAQNTPAATPEPATSEPAAEEAGDGVEAHHGETEPATDTGSEMEAHHDGGMTMEMEAGEHHEDTMPMEMSAEARHEDGMPMEMGAEAHHEDGSADEKAHQETDGHHDEMSEEKKMMESAHAPAGIGIRKDKPHHEKAHWGYEGDHGPFYWGDLKEEFATCKDGKRQSPIDISTAIVTSLAEIETDYHESPLNIVNNGHTIQVNYQPGSGITIGGKQFELLQFHFHSPSEHTVGGKAYPMVAHLVHKAGDGQLGVIGILLKEGEANALIDRIWAHLPPHAGEDVSIEGESINVSGLLPKDMTYFNYTGSLTTPPCSEDVNWMLLTTPVSLSSGQIERFRSLYANNARPVMPVNGRPIGLSN